MNYLLYCILRKPDQAAEPCLGIQAQPVTLVSQASLTAAISPLTQPTAPADLSWLIAYRQAVDFFQQRCTIIPMRYGAVFAGGVHVQRFLQQHRQRYWDLLLELEGCVEMGLRIMEEEQPSGASQRPPPRIAPMPEACAASGTSYLVQRKAYYAIQDHATAQSKTTLETIRSRFRGLYVKSKTDMSTSRFARQIAKVPMVSLYFLIPKPSLPAFRSRFERLCQENPAKLLLSGPWPPYNFVT